VNCKENAAQGKESWKNRSGDRGFAWVAKAKKAKDVESKKNGVGKEYHVVFRGNSPGKSFCYSTKKTKGICLEYPFGR